MNEELKLLIHNYLHELAPRWLNNHGKSVEIPCYFCGNPKNLSIYFPKLMYKCWVCHKTGSLYDLFEKYSSAEGFERYKALTKDIKRNLVEDVF